jgi:hypothetical protein
LALNREVLEKVLQRRLCRAPVDSLGVWHKCPYNRLEFAI